MTSLEQLLTVGPVAFKRTVNRIVNKVHPNPPEVINPKIRTEVQELHNAGLDAFKQGNYGTALGYYNHAIRLGGDKLAVWSLHDKARIMLLIGDTKNVTAAGTILEKAERILPKNAQIQASLGVAYGRFGYYKGALARYEAALKLDPNNYEAQIITPLDSPAEERAHKLHDKGLELMTAGKPYESLRYYEAAVAVAGDEEKAGWSIHDKGMALLSLGLYPEALHPLALAKALIKDSPIPLKDLKDAQNRYLNYQLQQLRSGKK